MIGIYDIDFSELLTTVSACWGLLLVAGVGIAALPWSDAELVASARALRDAATAPLRWLSPAMAAEGSRAPARLAVERVPAMSSATPRPASGTCSVQA